jgi:hypothetical protein
MLSLNSYFSGKDKTPSFLLKGRDAPKKASARVKSPQTTNTTRILSPKPRMGEVQIKRERPGKDYKTPIREIKG